MFRPPQPGVVPADSACRCAGSPVGNNGMGGVNMATSPDNDAPSPDDDPIKKEVVRLFVEHRDAVRRMCVWLVGQYDWEDFLQTVFLKVEEKYREGSMPASIDKERAWLNTFAKNQALNWRRNRKRRKTEPLDEAPADTRPGSEPAATRLHSDLLAWIAGLPPGEQKVMLLTLEHYSADEIAHITGLSKHAVYKYRNRALQKLRDPEFRQKAVSQWLLVLNAPNGPIQVHVDCVFQVTAPLDGAVVLFARPRSQDNWTQKCSHHVNSQVSADLPCRFVSPLTYDVMAECYSARDFQLLTNPDPHGEVRAEPFISSDVVKVEVGPAPSGSEDNHSHE